jgi:uncharacterized protein YjbI with pentapeptide repeats
MDFRYAQFANDASFSGGRLGLGPTASLNGPFYMAEFAGQANFRNVRFKSLRFWRTIFRNGANFNGAHGNGLQLFGAVVRGPLAFDDARLDGLELNGFGGAMVVDGEVVLRRASIDRLTLNRVTFKKAVDLEGASVGSRVSLRRVSFEDDFLLLDSVLPTPSGDDTPDGADQKQVSIRDVTLNKGLFMDASQFLDRPPWWAFWRQDVPRLYGKDVSDDPDDASAKDNRRIRRELMHAFEIAKNVGLKNYAEYQLNRLEEAGQTGTDKLSSAASRWFWGYGLKPTRAALWIAALILLFAGIYWTQLPAGDGRPLARFVTRARQALRFSLRTAWELKYGYDNSTTPAFRVITTIESLLAKAMLACFAYALAQTSPLLSEIMKKLLP